MIYLIGKLAIWLLLTTAFAALAGWGFAARRAAPAVQALAREREGLLRDLTRFAGGEVVVDEAANEREVEAMRRLLDVRDARIAELEQALGSARARADDAMSRIAELERAPAPSAQENEELARLRALTTQYEHERAREVEVEALPIADDETALQAWRLRYFEQRVKYLEGLPREPSPLAAPAHDEPPAMEWRAREAEARADYLANEMRALSARPIADDVDAFAANADVDALLRWRMLYLERRAAHLQAGVRPAETPVIDTAEAERWKWRARYLESRVRYLEQRPAAPLQVAAVPAPAPEPAPQRAPEAPPRRRAKPPVLSGARNGAPDDFTLIEGVSLLQQTTLYSLGVFHFDQVAAWTPENVAWVDQYLRLGGRIEDEEWVEQAEELARYGVAAARRERESEEA
jgi:predicted flap endonuclease-1-like 5' DNA nuclease